MDKNKSPTKLKKKNENQHADERSTRRRTGTSIVQLIEQEIRNHPIDSTDKLLTFDDRFP